MSSDLAFSLANGLHNQAALIAPQFGLQISAVLQQLASCDPANENKMAQERDNQMLANYGLSPETNVNPKPFAYSQGLAFIPIHGMLVNRFGYSWGYVTGYNFIRRQMDAALADPDVKGIVFDLNSYGGMVAGCFELAADIAAASKPTLSIADAAAYSACYALGSAADRMVAIPSAGVGSIGVIGMHVNLQKALEKFGVEITIIKSGEHKADGNPYESLPDNVKKSMQKSMDSTRAEFVNLVAANRGMDAKVVHDTEADTYRSAEAVELGLIDAVSSPQKAITAFLSELSGSNQKGDNQMSTQSNTPNAESSASANTQQLADARKAERARMSAITGCEEAKGKSKLANYIAMSTEMSVDEAKAMLAAAAPEKEETAAATTAATTTTTASNEPNPLAAAMAATGGGANVGADGNNQQSSANGTDDRAVGNRIVSNLNAAVGRKPAKA